LMPTDWDISEDGKTLSITADLAAGGTYQLSVMINSDMPPPPPGSDPEAAADCLSTYYFGTATFSDATVSGSLGFPGAGDGSPNWRCGEASVALLNRDPAEIIGDLPIPISKLAALLQDDGADGDEDPDEDPVMQALIRAAFPGSGELTYTLNHVPDGTYYILATLEGTDNRPTLAGTYDEDGDGQPDPIVVADGQSLDGIDAALRVMGPPPEPIELVGELLHVNFERRVLRVHAFDFGEVGVVLPAGLAVSTPDGSPVRLESLFPGTVLEIRGTAREEGGPVTATEVFVVDAEGPEEVRGSILSIEPPEENRPGILTITGPAFAFDEGKTRVESPVGRALGLGDLRPGMGVVVFFQEPQEPGRPELAVVVKMLSPGEPPPPPDVERGQFVGEIARVNFEERILRFGQAFFFDDATSFEDSAGGELTVGDLAMGARVGVIPEPTPFGLPGARVVRVLRGADEMPPEKILTAQLTGDGDPAPLKNAVGVPLSARVEVEFDRPLTEETLESVEVYIYSVATEEDVDLTPQVVEGRMVLELTLESDTVYEAYLALENGSEYFTSFSTGESLPSMRVESITPEGGTSDVETSTTLSVSFNREVSMEDGEIGAEVWVLPFPESGEIEQEDLELSDDGMTVSVDVKLRSDQTYLVVVYDAWSTDGYNMTTLSKIRFSTGTLGTARIDGAFDNPPGVFLGPDAREWLAFVYLLPDTTDFENLEGDDPERLGVAFDVSEQGGYNIENVPEGSYFIEAYMFIEEGPGGVELGLVGTVLDEQGDPEVLTLAEGEHKGAVRIRLSSELRVTESRPEPGASGVGTQTTLSVRFSEPLRRNRGVLALEAEIVPPIEGFDPRRDLLVNPERPRWVNAKLNLSEDTDYHLLIFYAQGVSGSELFDVVEIPFTTRSQFVAGRVSGTVTLSDESVPKGKVILGDLDEERRVGEVSVRKDGTYAFENVPAGRFGVFVNLVLSDGRTVRSLLDADGDGKPDAVELAEGETKENVDLSVTVPAAPSAGPAGDNASATFSFDFSTQSGDGGQSTGQANAGAELSVALYAQEVKDLVAYEVTVSYDTTSLVLQSVVDETSDEGINILKKNAGLGAFIGRVGSGTGTLSAVILGPSEEVAVDGAGLLGVLEFTALETFTGETELGVQTAVMQSLAGADSVTSNETGTVSAVVLTRSLGISASPSVITDTGKDTSVVSVKVLDLQGVVQTDDDTTKVTFTVLSGTGDLSSATVTADSGVAQTTLTSSTAGTVTIQASASGAKDV
ncbi:MAG: hypothetical protein QGI83_13955, partial [Candidatus Latescibacteria bacterium]|nr:hypothetical protein [Candidatus Latescibacterota bacterium]